MADDLRLYGPWTLSAEVLLVNDETGQQANVTITFGLGEAPGIARMWERANDARDGVTEQVGAGWRLATKQELFDAAMRERTGSDIQFALPGGNEWDELPTPTA